MGLDKANIFKLNDNELTKYQNDPFLDCFESTKVFAKALKNDIDTKETPHSLLLSADYVMGKTFFEIEGLFVILPTNKEALNDCIKSLYGIDNTKRIRRENYFQKFFNDKRIIKTPSQEDYIYAVNQYLTEDRLKEAFNKKLLSKQKEQYNSYKNLSMQKLSLFSILLKQIYRYWKLNIPNILQ